MIPPLFAILSYPVVVLVLFLSLTPRIALVWSLLLGYLFLPTKTAFDLPALPPLDKDTVPALAALCGMLAMSTRLAKTPATEPLPGWLPRNPVMRILLGLMLVGALMTAFSNRDALVYGGTVLPGQGLWDGLSAVLGAGMMVLPLLLARKYLGSEGGQQIILRALCLAGLVYSLPIIFELVMSPQLNRIVYGFFPHSWIQHIRNGGYRPLVFLEHGLWLGIFMCVTVLAAWGYVRTGPVQKRGFYVAAALWLLVILAACKALGALAIALLLMPAVLFMGASSRIVLAAVIATVILIYPALRGAGLVPVQRVVEIARSIADERARSLEFRLINEDILLEKANQRPAFGWGAWGRSRVYDEGGADISTTDGFWVIQIGQYGWVGYLSWFGMLCGPILLLATRRQDPTLSPTTSVMALLLTGNLIDLIPNAGLTPVTWMLAGALMGALEHRASENEVAGAPAQPARGAMRFTRFGGDQSTAATPKVRLARAAERGGRPLVKRSASRKDPNVV